MNDKFLLVSTILHESDHFGPEDTFQKQGNERILYVIDDVTRIVDERKWGIGSLKFPNIHSRINAKGKLILTDRRLFYQPKYFADGPGETLNFPINKLNSAEYDHTTYGWYSGRLTVRSENEDEPFVFVSKSSLLKNIHAALERTL